MRQELINEARQRKQEEEKKVEDLRLAKVVESMNVLQTRKSKSAAAQKNLNRDYIDHRARFEKIRFDQEYEQKEIKKKVQDGIVQRKKQAQRNMSYQFEENEKRKEIRSLHKMDQVEAFNRGKNFHMMYKQKLAERILEKSSRVPPKMSQL